VSENQGTNPQGFSGPLGGHMSATKSYGSSKKANTPKIPKQLHYNGAMHKVLRAVHERGMYVLQSRTDPKEEIEVPMKDYAPASAGSPRKR
jgi:hypothetical protein